MGEGVFRRIITGADRVEDGLTVLPAQCDSRGIEVDPVWGTVARRGTSSGFPLLLNDVHREAMASSCLRVDLDFDSAVFGIARAALRVGAVACSVALRDNTGGSSTVAKQAASF